MNCNCFETHLIEKIKDELVIRLVKGLTLDSFCEEDLDKNLIELVEIVRKKEASISQTN